MNPIPNIVLSKSAAQMPLMARQDFKKVLEQFLEVSKQRLRTLSQARQTAEPLAVSCAPSLEGLKTSAWPSLPHLKTSEILINQQSGPSLEAPQQVDPRFTGLLGSSTASERLVA